MPSLRRDTTMLNVAWPQFFWATGIAVSIGTMWLMFPNPVVGPGLVVLFLGVIAALNRSYILSLAFVIFSFFRIHEVFPVLIPLKLPLLLALAIFVSLAWSISFGRIRVFWDSLFLPFIVFFALVSLGIFSASNVGNSSAYWTGTYVKIGLMVFAIAWSLRRERDLRSGLRSILLAAGTVAVVALSNKLSGVGLVEGTRVTIGRDIGSVLGDPNDLSLVLLFGASFAVAAATGRGLPRLDRMLGLAVYIAVAAAVVATQSRGGLLGLAAITGVFVAERVKSKSLMMGLASVVFIALFVFADIDGRQSGGAYEAGIDESAMGRIYAWGAALRMALDNPLTGVGLDNFYLNYFFYSDFWDGRNHAVHSTWFGVLGETGVLGLAAFLWMVVAIFRRIRVATMALAQHAQPSPILSATLRGLLGGIVGFCVSGTFLTQAFTWPIYIILALTVATARITISDNSSKLLPNNILRPEAC